MSFTYIFGFDHSGEAHLCGTAQNSWRGAPLIWAYMEKEYLPPYMPPYLLELSEEMRARWIANTGTPTRTSTLRPDAIKEIWELVVDPLVPLNQRLVLATTLDNALIHRSDIPTIIKAFWEFPEEAGHTSLEEQARILRAYKINLDFIAFGWAQNSICSKSWGEYEPCDESGGMTPYNCLTGKDHYWLVEDTTDIVQLREYAEAKLAELDSGKVELNPRGELNVKWWQFDTGTPVEHIKKRVSHALQVAEKQVVRALREE